MSELILDTEVKFQMFRKGHEVEGRIIIPKDDYMIVAEDADYYYLAVSHPLGSSEKIESVYE